MKGYILYGILSELALGVNLTFDLFRTITLSPYGTSFNQMMRKLGRLNEESYAEYNEEQLKLKYKQMVYRLKRDGLVSSNNSRGAGALTDKGVKRLEKFKKGLVAISTTDYPKLRKTKVLKLVTFDIPETQRIKREWLRRVLLNLDFEMLQKSVWFGNSELPKSFITDLSKLGILDYVHIMAVTKAGTIEKLN